MLEIAPVSPGMRVLCRDAEWLVTRVESANSNNTEHAIHCIGVDDLVRGHESIFLTQLDTITPVDPRKTELKIDTSTNFRQAKLFVEAQLRQMPSTSLSPDLEGMGAFVPMNFQKEAVRHALNQLRPRLLLADAVGLGKTIEVGMIISELMRRGKADRILVLAKKSMLTQFQSELWNRFAIPLVRLDSQGIAKLRLKIPSNKNPFEVYHRIIISIDTLKDVGRYRHFLETTRWDVVVIDEAHNVAGATVPERHLSYRLARLLSGSTDAMILTTATPHNGKKETFGRLISLLDPSAIPDPKFKEYSAENIQSFFLMRFKEDIREEAGDNFSERIVVPRAKTSIDAFDKEESTFSVMGKIRDLSLQWKGQGKRCDSLLLYGLYKLFLSSPEACQATLHNRIEKLKKNDADAPEIGHLKKIQQTLEEQSLRSSSRFLILRKNLEEIGWKGKKNCPRILIFTEYRQTQLALAHALSSEFKCDFDEAFDKQKSQTIGVIHGSMPDTILMETVESFGTGNSPMRMLIATDVASEGINLHHQCHIIIHYDIPWSIITLIQRNGRIDRFGQKKNPLLHYIMVNTKDDLLKGDFKIFERLITKVEEINKARKPGESILKLYDPEAEESYIANRGILAGNENVFEEPADEATIADVNILEDLLKHAAELQKQETEELQKEQFEQSRLRLMADRTYLTEGYRWLKEKHQEFIDLEETERLIILTPPRELKRYLGSPDSDSDVIFGGTAIPQEAWASDGQIRLTDKRDQVELSIEAARNTSGYWTHEMLTTDQHPVLKWITERLLMTLNRGEAPMIASPHLDNGEIAFCFIGQLCSKAGRPIAIDSHAVSFLPGGKTAQYSLRELLERAGFLDLTNAPREANVNAAKPLLHAAVETSLDTMVALHDKAVKSVLPLLRKEERRLRNWKLQREELLQKLINDAGSEKVRARFVHELQEVNRYVDDRKKNWQDMYFNERANPATNLVLVIEGI